MLNDKNKSQFSLGPVEGSSNFLTNNYTNPQLVQIKGATMTFQNGNRYDLYDPDLSKFITNTQLDTQPQNKNLVQSFPDDEKYIIEKGDMKSDRYNFFEQVLQPQLASEFIQYFFLPSDPDALVYHLNLIVSEKVGGKDNPMLSEQIVAIVDKLLQQECITTNQHQNMQSTFSFVPAFTSSIDEYVYVE